MTVRGFETADGRTVEPGQFGGFPEVGDLEAERQLADVLVGTAAERLLDGAQDVSDGGLAQALVEGVLRYGTGARIALPFDLDPFEALVAVRARADLRLRELCEATGVPYTAIGTTDGDALHEAALPVAFER
jgi:phosphoribosylformylglycinamidine (FGAM) synthase-like enzyme